MNSNALTIGGVDFELVRTPHPRKPGAIYWRVKTPENGYVFEGGCFPRNQSRPALKAELEDAFRRAGNAEEFRRRLSLTD